MINPLPADAAAFDEPASETPLLTPERGGSERREQPQKSVALHGGAPPLIGTTGSRSLRETESRREYRQRSERVPAQIQAHLWINGEVLDRDAHTANVSEDGMFVVTTKPLPVGTTTRFQITLPDGELIAGFAEVAWIRPHYEHSSRPNGMGVRYTAIRGNGKGLLRRFVLESLDATHNASVTVHEQAL
jgi:uncharacterized protein (TIGR02266 family)